jgi:predicted HTH domain antitoxin
MEIEVMCEISEKIRMEGRKEGQLGTLIDLVRDNLITISEAAKRAEMTEANFAQLLKTK